MTQSQSRQGSEESLLLPPKSVHLKIHRGLEPENLAAEDGKLLPSVIMENSDAILSLLPTRLKDARRAKGLLLDAVSSCRAFLAA